MNFDLLTFENEKNVIKVVGNEVAGIQKQKITKNAIRIFREGKIFSSAKIGSFGRDQLLTSARTNENVGIPYDYNLPDTAAFSFQQDKKLNIADLEASFLSFFEELRKENPDLIWNGRFSVNRSYENFESDYTGELLATGEFAELMLMCKLRGSVDFLDGYMSYQGNNLDFKKQMELSHPLISCSREILPLSTKKMPVLFFESNDFTDRLSQDILPDKFYAGSSYLSGKMGQTLFDKRVNLVDVSFAPEKGRYSRFDGEGVLRENKTLVEAGRFKDVIYDLRESKRYATISTGNGKRAFNTGVTLGAYELSLVPGPKKYQDILASLPECLLVYVSAGGSCDESWNYSTPVQVAYIARFGKIVGKAPPISIRGRLENIFGSDLIEIASNGIGLNDVSPSFFSELDVLVH